ncbi:hypothetical protein B0H11DRAFT_1334299 [Mycena galericulata]|nr:hypothetical protein B0H11DRAFT_1334299 [Mycena galericulata]
MSVVVFRVSDSRCLNVGPTPTFQQPVSFVLGYSVSTAFVSESLYFLNLGSNNNGQPLKHLIPFPAHMAAMNDIANDFRSSLISLSSLSSRAEVYARDGDVLFFWRISIRRELLQVFKHLINSPEFLKTRSWSLKNLKAFDREAYIDAVLN